MPEPLPDIFAPKLALKIDDAVRALAPEKKGVVTFGASKAGADVGVALRVGRGIEIGATAQRMWAGGGWDAGLKGKVSF